MILYFEFIVCSQVVEIVFFFKKEVSCVLFSKLLLKKIRLLLKLDPDTLFMMIMGDQCMTLT